MVIKSDNNAKTNDGDSNAHEVKVEGDRGNEDGAAVAPIIHKVKEEGDTQEEDAGLDTKSPTAVDVSAIDAHDVDYEIEAAIKEKDSEDAAQEEADAASYTNNASPDQKEDSSHESNPEQVEVEVEVGGGEEEDNHDEDDGSRSNNGSSVHEEDEDKDVSEGEDQASESDAHSNASNQPPYPPLPHGYEHYPPPPPGYYPYPPYPPHPHYGYPPPPPGYYPPPPGYYPPPPGLHPHPAHMPPGPPHAPLPAGERDPTTGSFIYGGPPPTQPVAAKRSRMRIKTPQDIVNRKIRKNAQSRHRAARLREKVDTIKIKGNEMTEEEVNIYTTVEERRSRKNNRSRERALEKKAELERIQNKPENQRTKEEVEIFDTAVAAKKRKNEGDRLRRERIKKMGLKVKPPGMSIHSRPRKPLSGENILPYGTALPGMAGVPDMAAPPVLPVPPPVGLPPLPGGSEAVYQYPPAPHPHAYPPPNPYYAEPPPMKEEENSGDEDGQDHNNDEDDDMPGSANTEQEVSELLLDDPPDVGVEENDNHVDVSDVMKDDVSEAIEC